MVRAAAPRQASLSFLLVAIVASTAPALAAAEDPTAAVLPLYWADKEAINVCTAETVPSEQMQPAACATRPPPAAAAGCGSRQPLPHPRSRLLLRARATRL